MKIIFGRHAKRQMKWRKVTEKEVKSAIGNPDMLMDTIKGRKNAFKIIKGRRLKITYKPEDGILTVITAMVKGE
jgi:hypothetical protein